MTTLTTPPPDCPAPVRTGPDSQDPPGWRLAFVLVTAALDGGWAKFARAIVLLLVLTAAVSLVVHLLGPLAVGGLGLGTAGATALARRRRINAPVRNAPNRNAGSRPPSMIKVRRPLHQFDQALR